MKRTVLSFGQHRGKAITQVDDAYLHWIQANVESGWWRRLAAEEMASRVRARAETRKVGTKRTNISSLLAELRACSSSRNLDRGEELHAAAVQVGDHCNIYVACALVNMYGKCGRMCEARRVFDSIKQPDMALWNALMMGYAENGEAIAAFHMFATLKAHGCRPDCITFVAALKACTSLAEAGGKAECRRRGKQIHLLAVEDGLDSDAFVQTTLIDMYAKCGSMVDARNVFDSLRCPDVASWNALISGYAENGEGISALDWFAKMGSEGFVADALTFVAALKACISLAGSGTGECGERGRHIHRLASESGYDSDIYVQNSLIDMYAKCGGMSDARAVFNSINRPNVVSWTALILGYATNGEGLTALDLFSVMKTRGCAANSVTFVAALKACTYLALEQDTTGRVKCMQSGKEIHRLLLKSGCDSDTYVQNTLIDMYCNCGCMVDAQTVFDRIKHPDVVSWNALILGYAENGNGATALDLFTRMRSQGCLPDSITFVAALKAAGLLGALEIGSKIHAEVMSNVELDVMLVTCLVDFYAKCGNLAEAQKVFDSHPSKRVLTTWTALLAGYSRVGNTQAVFLLFEAMQDAGFQPNAVTFTCVLTCCSHAGLVDEGKECFELMSTKYGIVPTLDHYGCLLDILGRSNKMEDAIVLLRSMPCSPDAITWMTVLSACCKWKNLEIGELAFRSLVSLGDTNGAAYALMAEIYGSRGMVLEQERLLEMRPGKRVDSYFSSLKQGMNSRSPSLCKTQQVGLFSLDTFPVTKNSKTSVTV